MGKTTPSTERPQDILHASAVAVDDKGVLILGASGSGKSGLALRLISMGACLIADDRTILWCENDHLFAQCPGAIEGKIEARGVGLLHTPAAGPTRIDLIVDLDQQETERLPQVHHMHLMGTTVPVLGNPGFDHFPAAIMLYLRHGRWQ